MKHPKHPPKIEHLLEKFRNSGRISEVMVLLSRQDLDENYYHWDELKYRKPPKGFDHMEWWCAIKLARAARLRTVDLMDAGKPGRTFQYCITERMSELLHEIDTGGGGILGSSDPLISSNLKDKYIISSLIEESITSSQLEGASTTREVAKNLIQSGREPKNRSERMIVNNFSTMMQLQDLRHSKLTTEIVMEIHSMVTRYTLDDESASGRFRNSNEKILVGDMFGEVFHTPPPADELEVRLEKMCSFANGETPYYYVHPVVRAIILHFWLAYDHPFVDGNGRTARALFYWAMLRTGYWLFEYISISAILEKAPVKYGQSFLKTETDENDLTYFISSQCEVINKAIKRLHDYIEEKTLERKDKYSNLWLHKLLNERQLELITSASKNPGQNISIAIHQKNHGVVYQTARTDLLDLAEKGLLEKVMHGKKWVFISPPDLEERLDKLEHNNKSD